MIEHECAGDWYQWTDQEVVTARATDKDFKDVIAAWELECRICHKLLDAKVRKAR